MFGRIGMAATRVGGVARKELTELRRQPRMLASLVLGPLLILLVFGASVKPDDPAVRSIFVTPAAQPELAEIVAAYADTQSERLTIADVTSDEEGARQTLREGDVDLLVIFPDDPAGAVREGRRSTIEVVHSFIDPLEVQTIRLFTRGAVDDLNDILLSLVIREAQDGAGRALEQVVIAQEQAQAEQAASGSPQTGSPTPSGTPTDLEALSLSLDGATVELQDILELDPTVAAAPLEGEATSIGGAVTTSQYYAPAVVALILQHLTVTFVALARTRERELGTDELFAVSPLRPVERLAGQALAYLTFGAALAAVLLAAVATLLQAPVRGEISDLAIMVVLELLASIGIGLVIARVASTGTQVVQGAMLMLLLSVFFGGLLLSPERLLPWARPVGWVLPMTFSLTSYRDTMLRGLPLEETAVTAVAGLAAITLVIAALTTRRRA